MSSATEKQQDVVIEETVDETHVEHAFCYDITHGCHTNSALLNQLGSTVESGLASPEDAERSYQGRTV